MTLGIWLLLRQPVGLPTDLWTVLALVDDTPCRIEGASPFGPATYTTRFEGDRLVEARTEYAEPHREPQVARLTWEGDKLTRIEHFPADAPNQADIVVEWKWTGDQLTAVRHHQPNSPGSKDRHWALGWSNNRPHTVSYTKGDFHAFDATLVYDGTGRPASATVQSSGATSIQRSYVWEEGRLEEIQSLNYAAKEHLDLLWEGDRLVSMTMDGRPHVKVHYCD